MVEILFGEPAPGWRELAGIRQAVPTLGTFFGIWGQPLSRSEVGGITSQPVTVYVKDDGQGLVEYTGDIAALEFASRREITIVIGTPPAAIPTYAWGTEQ